MVYITILISDTSLLFNNQTLIEIQNEEFKTHLTVAFYLRLFFLTVLFPPAHFPLLLCSILNGTSLAHLFWRALLFHSFFLLYNGEAFS